MSSLGRKLLAGLIAAVVFWTGTTAIKELALGERESIILATCAGPVIGIASINTLESLWLGKREVAPLLFTLFLVWALCSSFAVGELLIHRATQTNGDLIFTWIYGVLPPVAVIVSTYSGTLGALLLFSLYLTILLVCRSLRSTYARA